MSVSIPLKRVKENVKPRAPKLNVKDGKENASLPIAKQCERLIIRSE